MAHRHRYINWEELGLLNYTHFGVYKGNTKSSQSQLRSELANCNMSPFSKIVNLGMVSGLRHKSFLTITRAFSKIWYLLKFEQDSNRIQHLSSRFIDFVLIRNLHASSAFQINDFLYNLTLELSPVFSLKTQKPLIKRRSKKLPKYNVRIVYVKPSSRNLVALKWLMTSPIWFVGRD